MKSKLILAALTATLVAGIVGPVVAQTTKQPPQQGQSATDRRLDNDKADRKDQGD